MPLSARSCRRARVLNGTTEPENPPYRQTIMRTQRDTIPDAGRSTKGARRVALVAFPLALGLAVGVWWAGSQGYIPPVWEGGWGCSDVGYSSPPPSFKELVEEYDESPYCARRVRDEVWL